MFTAVSPLGICRFKLEIVSDQTNVRHERPNPAKRRFFPNPNSPRLMPQAPAFRSSSPMELMETGAAVQVHSVWVVHASQPLARGIG